MSIQTKVIISLVLLAVVDTVLPVPILGVILLYVAVRTPAWFPALVRAVYTKEQ